jgi:hypothetical protein
MGKPKHSNDRRGEQKGAQQHAEGQYGPKAYKAKFAEISSHDGSRRQSERAMTDPNRGGGRGDQQAALHEQEMSDPSMRGGRHRLVESRKQHDEAEKNSEKNRRIIDVEAHGHDPDQFQMPGGRASARAEPKDRSGPIVGSGGKGGGRA